MSKLITYIKNILSEQFGIYITHVNPIDFVTFKSQLFESILILSSNVLHIGGNSGQEAQYYDSLKCNVFWVEADPDVERKLQENIQKFRNQKSVPRLMLDRPGVEKEFKVFNNSGISSSIFDLAADNGFEKLNLRVDDVKTIETSTIDILFSEVDLHAYTHWVIDVQGSELLVLQGAIESLRYCHSMTIEVSTREVYQGGCKYEELREFLHTYGFRPLWQPESDYHGEIIFLKTF